MEKWYQIADLHCSSFSALISPYSDHNNKVKYKAVLLAFQIETEINSKVDPNHNDLIIKDDYVGAEICDEEEDITDDSNTAAGIDLLLFFMKIIYPKNSIRKLDFSWILKDLFMKRKRIVNNLWCWWGWVFL